MVERELDQVGEKLRTWTRPPPRPAYSPQGHWGSLHPKRRKHDTNYLTIFKRRSWPNASEWTSGRMPDHVGCGMF
jgi:hypothetical protein